MKKVEATITRDGSTLLVDASSKTGNALKAAGFKPGDKVAIVLASDLSDVAASPPAPADKEEPMSWWIAQLSSRQFTRVLARGADQALTEAARQLRADRRVFMSVTRVGDPPAPVPVTVDPNVVVAGQRRVMSSGRDQKYPYTVLRKDPSRERFWILKFDDEDKEYSWVDYVIRYDRLG